MKQYATVLLPSGTFAETSGSYLNAEGRWQSFLGMTQPLGESRPGWKILRVLGNLCDAEGFDYSSSEEVLKEAKAATDGVKPDTVFTGLRIVTAGEKLKGFQRVAEVPLYSSDMLVRRALPLQQTRDADNRWIRLSPTDAKKLGVADGEPLCVDAGSASVELPVKLDASVAPGNVFLAAGIPETAAFGAFHMQLQLAKPQ